MVTRGYLKISWHYTMKYNKGIDLVYFPQGDSDDTEKTTYCYYLLYAHDFPKTINEYGENRFGYKGNLEEVKIPYDINNDLAKEILSKSSLTKAQQEKFFNSRFGSVLVPVETDDIEEYFIWWHIWKIGDRDRAIGRTAMSYQITFPLYDKYFEITSSWDKRFYEIYLLILDTYKVLPPNTALRPSRYRVESLLYQGTYPLEEVAAPLPTSALAYTHSNMDKFIVNLRDQPSKEGKILAQLFSQALKSTPKDLFLEDREYQGEYNINPLYEEMVTKGRKWFLEDREWGDWVEEMMGFQYYFVRTKQVYYQANKSKLINPLEAKEYLVLVWNIDANNWAKVWILKMLEGYVVHDVIGGRGMLHASYFDDDGPALEDLENYTKTFLESPSKLKLYEGYIHTNGLDYLLPFGGDYIQR